MMAFVQEIFASGRWVSYMNPNVLVIHFFTKIGCSEEILIFWKLAKFDVYLAKAFSHQNWTVGIYLDVVHLNLFMITFCN